MEKLAVISDIHSNLEALTSVLNDISGQSIQKIVSLGDNIGYGPDPEDVLLKLKSCLVTSIRGNHEFAILNDSYKRLFNLNAITALDINRKNYQAARYNTFLHWIQAWHCMEPYLSMASLQI